MGKAAKKPRKAKNVAGGPGVFATRKEVRQQFLGWQCRIRQDAMRRHEGKPSSGMRPGVLLPDGSEVIEALTVMLVPRDPEDITKQFQFTVRKSPDPRKVFEDALKFMQADYYQQPKTFTDRMTAVLAGEAAAAEQLVAAGECTLVFEQYGQVWKFACRVKKLKPTSKAFRHTLWHNRQFNTQLPDDVTILAFRPKWKTAREYAPAS